MRRIGLDTLVPDLKRLVGDLSREELLAVAERQREIEKTHADALSRSARTGSSAPAEAYETAWRTHCRAYVYAALAEPLAPDARAREHWQAPEVAAIWEQGCASAGTAPWQVHAATVRARDGDRAREKRVAPAPAGKTRLSRDVRPPREARLSREGRPPREERPSRDTKSARDAKLMARDRPPAKTGPRTDGKPPRPRSAGPKPAGAQSAGPRPPSARPSGGKPGTRPSGSRPGGGRRDRP